MDAADRTEGVKQGIILHSKCGMYRYHISIIDYLQKYDCSKFFERQYKIIMNWSSIHPSEISSMNSDDYGDRFHKYM